MKLVGLCYLWRDAEYWCPFDHSFLMVLRDEGIVGPLEYHPQPVGPDRSRPDL